MKRAIFLLMLSLATLRVQAQAYYLTTCLWGDCEDSLSALREYGGGNNISITIGSRFYKLKHKPIRPDVGIVYEFQFGNALEASVWKKQYRDRRYSPDHLAFITETTMKASINASEYADFEDGSIRGQYMGAAYYRGTFVNRKPEGRGRLQYDEDHKLAAVFGDSVTLKEYIGSFKNGNPHGTGHLYYTNGKSDSVMFDNGMLVSPQTPDQQGFRSGCISGNCELGWGTYVWNHSQIYKYTGFFRHGQPVVFGMFQYMNGELYMGELSDSGQYRGRGCYWHYPYMQENGRFAAGEYIDSSGYVHDELSSWMMTNTLAHSAYVQPTPGKCSMCRGKGVVDDGDCKGCHGRGYHTSTFYHVTDNIIDTRIHGDGSRTITYEKQGYSSSTSVCEKCHGTGRHLITCPQCKGKGVY